MTKENPPLDVFKSCIYNVIKPIIGITLLILICLPTQLFAQVSDYDFSHRSFGLSQLNGLSLLKPKDVFDPTKQGAIVINNSLEEDTTFSTGPGFPIGFDFYFDGEYFDRFAASTNGYIKLGKSTAGFTIKSDTLAGEVFGQDFAKERQNVIAAFQTNVSTRIPFEHTLLYEPGKGFPGEKVMTVDWNFFYPTFYYDEYPSGKPRIVRAQARLFQSNGKIEFSYSAGLPFATHIKKVAVGLRGSQLNNSPSNLHLRSVIDGENNWASSYKSTSPDSLMDFSRDLIAIHRPEDPGSRTFTFTPPVDSSAQPACPITYFLVPDHYPGAIYGDNTDHYILANNADSVSLNPRLGWSPASLLENTYDLYLSTDNPPTQPLVTGIKGTRWQLPELAPGTTYYIGIVARNANGSTPLCMTSFTTSGNREYCNVSSPGGNGVIESLEFNTLHFQSSPEVDNVVVFPAAPPYTTTLSRGETYTLRYTQAAIPGQRLSIFAFIDFNQNGLLSETNTGTDGEAFSIGALGPPAGTLETQITIPSDASLGNTRIRIRLIRPTFAGNPWDPCAFTNGLTQDYIITIGPSTACAGFAMSPNVQSLSCFNAGDGSIDLQLSGGVEPYIIQWEKNGQPYTTNGSSIGGLERATYQAFVEDATGCDMQTPLIAVTQPTGLQLAGSSVSGPACANEATGQVAVTVEGGTGPYTYLWSNGQSNAMAENLGQGEYSVIITDDRGCKLTPAPFSVVAPEPLTIANETISSESCAGTADGQINLTIEGGIAPYAFLWSDGQTTAMARDLASGQHSVTITDENGCQLIPKPFTIEPLQPLTLSQQKIVNESCSEADDGQVAVTVEGGTGPYTFLWSNGQSNAMAENLAQGEYSVIITDDRGCKLTPAPFSVVAPEPLTIANETISNENCAGTADGQINLTIEGGTAPYAFRWSDGQTAATARDLASGQHSVTITDENGCQLIPKPFTIEPLQPLTLSQQKIVNESCSEAHDGQVALEVSGGTAPYSFLWNNGQTTPTATALSTGEYIATITDNKGCQLITDLFTITGPDPLVTTIQINTQAQSTNLIVLTSGGTPPYRYTWSNGHLSEVFEDAPPGEYTVTVNDAKGCVYTVDGIEVRPQVTTSLTPDLEAGLSFYPNPAHQKVFLKVPQTNQHWKLSIVSAVGGKFWQQTVTPNSKSNGLSIDVSALPPGQYYLVIQDNNRSYAEKLVIQ